ncbi:hypothetical protein SAMN05216242_104129 [Thauera chlorobenzoica]|nr:hypothetical protein SAMN05216242_104129 [Thauera chlorobenzoica]
MQPLERVVSLEDIGPELSLWLAVVGQLIEDAIDFAKHGDDRHGYRLEAHLELNRPGPMLQRLTGLAGVDRDTVLAAYRRRLKGYAVAKSPTCGPETGRLSPHP